jgi:hypothetical protein
MVDVTFQTIRLSRGKHPSPEHGACVMELASMLAGERFSDHPKAVCPVIGAFLRVYNDALDDRRRQDLYACAARVVGSRASNAVTVARAQRLAAWSGMRPPREWPRWLGPASGIGTRQYIDALAKHAVKSIRPHSDESHASVMMAIDELLAIGDTPTEDPEGGGVSAPTALLG